MPSRNRNWVFTLNNPVLPEDDPSNFLSTAMYCVWQLEKGESGTIHIQGYCIFRTLKSLSSLRTLQSRAHWEIRRGTHAEAKAYCTKEDSRHLVDGSAVAGEFGYEPRGSGPRS